ncbi:UNVERIFIED_CONTAM: hypothetical protein NCL1_40464 [Trichonephila clavipes]
MFTRSLANRKHLVHGCRDASSSPYANQYKFYELVHRVEATWAYVPVHAIQSLIDAMPRRISGVITLKVVVLGTDFSGSMHLNFLKI